MKPASTGSPGVLDREAFEGASVADLLSLEAIEPESDGEPEVPATGARRLAVEVLRQAICDAQQGDVDASNWIYGTPVLPVRGFAFDDLCLALDLDPSALRARVRELPRLRRRWRPDTPRRLATAA